MLQVNAELVKDAAFLHKDANKKQALRFFFLEI